MELADKEKATLISDIETDARADVEEIIRQAQERAAEKRKYGDKQVASRLNEAREKAEEQAEAVKKKAVSAMELEVRRRSMRLQAAVMQDVMDRVEKKLHAMVEDADYRSVLVRWIVEAAVGLGAESAEVNASETERAMIDDALLSEAVGQVHAAAGRQVALTLATAGPLQSQGVVLTAADGRTAFNNQVRTRLLRSQRRIQMLIHDALFTDRREQ